MNPDGSFKMLDEDTLGSSFYFPISLLNELGYFRPSLRFWTWQSFPEALEVATKVGQRINAMGLTDTESAKVLRIFDDARREQRAWRMGGAITLVTLLWLGWRVVKYFRRRTIR
jgi:hypothetical protein